MAVTADHLPQYSHDFDPSDGTMYLWAEVNGSTQYGSKWSFTCRFKRAAVSTYHYFVNHRSTTVNTGWYVRINQNGRIRLQIGATWGEFLGEVWGATATTVNDTNWHEVLAIFDLGNSTVSDRLIIYLDGTRQSFAASNIPSADITPRHSTGQIRIGADQESLNGFDGLLYNIGASKSGNLLSTSDIRESDGTAKDLKDYTNLSFHPNIDAGEVGSDWVIPSWTVANGLTTSTTLGDSLE